MQKRPIVVAERSLVLIHAKISNAMSHICIEGNCALVAKSFSSSRGLRAHQQRCHANDAEDEMSLGNSRTLKRQRDAEEEARKRQRLELEAWLALEAAHREVELPLVLLMEVVMEK